MEKIPTIKEQLKGKTKTVEYLAGQVEYLVLGDQSEQNPIAIVPGYTEGLIALHNFGRDLSVQGKRQVLITEQPLIDSKHSLDPVDHLAEAWLAAIEANNWQNRPVDVVAHSLGAIVFERAATLAYLRGWECFDNEQGSKTIFVGPAGTNPEESFVSMTPRYLKLMQTIVAGKEKDDSKKAENGKEIIDQGIKTTLQQPTKYLREIRPILNERIQYSRLGRVGVRPFVFGYNEDQLFSHRIIGPTMETAQEHIAGYAMPADKNATHNHLLYDDLTVRSVLQILDSEVAGVPANR